MTETNGRKPRTGDTKLRVQWRHGDWSMYAYTANQLRWTHTGSPFDVVAVERER